MYVRTYYTVVVVTKCRPVGKHREYEKLQCRKKELCGKGDWKRQRRNGIKGTRQGLIYGCIKVEAMKIPRHLILTVNLWPAIQIASERREMKACLVIYLRCLRRRGKFARIIYEFNGNIVLSKFYYRLIATKCLPIFFCF